MPPVTDVRLGCQAEPKLFLHPLLESPPTGSAPLGQRRQAAVLTRRAAELCQRCPVLDDCLYAAVVEHDVAGFVAGTTQRERRAVRRRLGVVLPQEDFDPLTGASRRHRPVDHAEVLRARAADPTASLEQLAQRLGCSLSTVKRHLRRERTATPTPTPVRVRPSVDAVRAAASEVLGWAAAPEPDRATAA